MTRSARRALSALTSAALLAGLFVGAPAPVRAAETVYVGHQVNDYAPGSECASPDYETDGEWSGGGLYDSDDDAMQDAIDNAASGDTIFVCSGHYDFDTDLDIFDIGMNLTIVGDGIGETVLDGTDSTRLINANPAGAADAGGTLTLRDLSIEDARTASVFDNGGAVNADGLSLIRVSISGSDNAYNGGALYAEGNVSIVDSTFTDNDTSEYGAVVYAWNPARTVSISNSVFDGNDSGKGGGAILATTVTVTGSTFTDNNAVIDGGAILATTVTVTGSTFTDNDADDDGGAIYADNVTVTGSTFTDNDADGSSGGGAILAYTATVTDSTFTNNTADSYGGAISAYITTATGSSFTDNTANYGGAINTYTATVSNSTFRGNDAVYFGGAIQATTATVSASTFRGNTADLYGGAIFSTTNTVTSSTFISNSAVLGGAIRADTATVSNSTFTSNTSVNAGGAISASTGAVAGSRFTRNTSGTHGGAIYFSSPALTDLRLMRRNSFSRNTAAVGGAMTFGPCGTPSRSQAARVERANRFSGNRATEQRRTNSIERLEGGCT